MSETKVDRVRTALHKKVHEELKGVATAIAVSADREHLDVELLFRVNDSNLSVHTKVPQSVIREYPIKDVVEQTYNTLVYDMKNTLFMSYRR